MNRIRDFLYLHLTRDPLRIDGYGLEFADFMAAVLDRMDHMLVLRGEGDFIGSFSRNLSRTRLSGDELHGIAGECVYNYGDFSWFDFTSVSALESLTPPELAEIYYLENKWTPLSSPMLDRIGNRFFYLAHDDGWHNRCYFRHEQDLRDVLSRNIVARLEKLMHLRKPRMINPACLSTLLDVAAGGAIVDMKRTRKEKNRLLVPVFAVGPYHDMDAVYEARERLGDSASVMELVVRA